MPPALIPNVSAEICSGLVDHGFGPFFGTPCGVLAPLYGALERTVGLMTVPREDTALGMAAGAALGGALPAVLMQNSGLGQCVNALASLVVPYRIPLLLVISLRGIPPDTTEENRLMGRLTGPLLVDLGIATAVLGETEVPSWQIAQLADIVRHGGAPAALLVPPDALGWAP